MRKILAMFGILLLLSGCAAEEAAETVSDEWVEPILAEPREIALDLPGDASVCAMESGSGRLYLSEGYEIAVQTLSAGDLDGTFRTLTGFSGEDMTVVKTRASDADRYEFVWAAEGERGDRLGRGVLLDDGSYHYCLTVLQDVDSMAACQVIWSQVLQSFQLA